MAPSPRLSPLFLLLAAASLATAADGAADATAAAAASEAASESASEAAKPPQPHTLVALTAETFDSATAEGLWLIEFYAPWCAHCKALEPVLREAAAALGPQLLFGQVDATAHGALAKAHGVKGYPTLLWRRGGGSGGLLRPYKGTRKAEGFARFAERMNAPPVQALLPGAAELKEAAGATPVLFLLVLPPPAAADAHGSGGAGTAVGALPKLEAAFASVAAAHQHLLNVAFASTADGGALALALQGATAADRAAAMAAVGGSGGGSGEAPSATQAPRACVLKLDADITTLWDGGSSAEAGGSGGSLATSALAHWVGEERFPLLASIGASNFREISQERKGRLLVVGVVDPHDEAKTLPFIRMLRRLALPAAHAVGHGDGHGEGGGGSPLPAAVAARLGFSYIDGTLWGKFVSQFNVRHDKLPHLFVLDGPASVFYEDPEVDEQDEVETFLADVVAGRVPAQREGMGGLPGRISSMLSRHYPLSLLFAVPPLLLIVALVQCCLAQEEEEDDDDEEEEEEEDEKKEGGDADKQKAE
jgi:thiol-disulfide isomerase/thioredoxin